MTQVLIERPWVEFDLGAQMRVLSWAINRPGLVSARRILWREVRNADLPPDLDVHSWLGTVLADRKAEDAVCFLTSRDVSATTQAKAQVGAAQAQAVATVGLSNAERIGTRFMRDPSAWGTINVAVRLNVGLTETAMLEAVSIATQARTAAVMEVGLQLPTGLATGTGTDCIAVASPEGTEPFAGLHTEVGHALGQAVYSAVLDGATAWMVSPGAAGPGLKPA
ncbi:adenosylcobinamide amidohydrolase [Thalassovita sp.]|uniref:adenosylcobinamide amidohydrolase n=1 Tax=Thalassovita sp. TaxID=1979401 RepID=UPI0028810AF5|nr:adenosylcobinamide amidohydrolase [Thalassovita sp.]MDF1803422.1 adenosylcobinamide amidohydrolase [Thalassovita sp.]